MARLCNSRGIWSQWSLPDSRRHDWSNHRWSPVVGLLQRNLLDDHSLGSLRLRNLHSGTFSIPNVEQLFKSGLRWIERDLFMGSNKPRNSGLPSLSGAFRNTSDECVLAIIGW